MSQPSETSPQDQHQEEKQGTEGCQNVPIKLPCAQAAGNPEIENKLVTNTIMLI